MRKIAIGLLIALSLAATAGINAAETEVNGRLYAYWNMDLTDGADNFNEFALSRAYVTVKSKLSDYTSVRITTDLREASVEGSRVYNIILKYAYLDWKPAFAGGAVKLRFGLQPTHYIDNMNKLWGRRYLEKTVGDLRKFLTTSDLGAGLVFSLGEEGKVGYIAANVWNGTSYTSLTELNKHKDFSGFVSVTPLKDNDDFKRTALQGQAYFGTQNRTFFIGQVPADYDRALFSFGGLVAYRNSFDIGGDVNFNSEGQGAGVDDLKETGYSFFGTIYLEDLVADESFLRTLNMFGRVDMYDPNTDADEDAETTVIGGIECVPVSGFRASVNIRSMSLQDEGVGSETCVYVNTLFKF